MHITGRLLTFATLGFLFGAGCANVSSEHGTGGTSGGNGTGGHTGGFDAGPIELRPPQDVIVPDGSSACGNKTIDTGEECDDGNLNDKDGCSSTCQKEPGFNCPTAGELCEAICGDGILVSTEACDDGNTNDHDGCAGNCQSVDTGYQCRVPGRACVPLCGDGIITGTENCDDKNTDNGDGCSSNCLREPGASCTGMPSVCTIAKCGNCMVEEGESCDACDSMGNSTNGVFHGDGTGCSKTCTKEPSCHDSSGKNQACAAVCGDGNIDMAAGEQCDDGNQVNGDGCSSTCQNESGFQCSAMMKADTVPCTGIDPVTGTTNTGNCLELPVTYRDFKDEHQTGGHPDFYYYGTTSGGKVTRACVPNSSGPAHGGDATARCWGIVQDTTLNSKPQLNMAATTSTFCACQFTDWSSDTNGGHVPGYTEAANGPLRTLEGNTPNPITYANSGHPQWVGTVPMVTSAASFGQWFTDSAGSSPANAHTIGTLELAPTANGQFRFSSNPDSVQGGFFPLDMAPAPNAAGNTAAGEPLLCNLWPYWAPAATFPGCKGDQYLFPPSIPAAVQTTANCATMTPPGCVAGTWVTADQGHYHDSWFSDEVHYYFVFPATGGVTLQFYGDDDMYIFINGVLVVDLGGVHQRLPGKVVVNDAGDTATITEGGFLDATGNILPCPSNDPTDPTNTRNYPKAATPADCRARTLTGTSTPKWPALEAGKTYEIAIFGADRHPTESNYQLTLNGFSTSETVCMPVCGDDVVSGGEECDLGNDMNTGAYGGCTSDCKYGPYCGDGNTDSPQEECDLGANNGATYITDPSMPGCSTACTKPHYCGDGIVDKANGEQCDLGSNNGVAVAIGNGDTAVVCDTKCMVHNQ